MPDLTQPQAISDWLLEAAREAGAELPTFAHSTDETPVILDTDSGRTWKITLEEF